MVKMVKKLCNSLNDGERLILKILLSPYLEPNLSCNCICLNNFLVHCPFKQSLAKILNYLLRIQKPNTQIKCSMVS